ncbi:MAG TPA: tetratricopeptide repeat protein [Thiobacillus sp.]|nr:MAG: hypothetical protein B7Y50_02440 [Hydrogenophilales bacterium 28-61-11]OYZ58083.1 MAG: hypothetical protein B7Y21_04885 [Hydrogenophilales bacterium 16-61-112]OZA47762.1 MAG: hypothetical protein B7X81_04860 [Hydrogenophilales bacterium 17-61-76]HQT31614.1 tetratricopeptide repeat protein [Thiobacillus sp.]HQT71448.1 tetratricopeptide repeat protein [Thiobacillus sp.]
MSIINQMLRDLDARGEAAGEVPVSPSPAAVKQHARGLPVRVAMAGVALGALGALGYWIGMATPERSVPKSPVLVVSPETRTGAQSPAALERAPAMALVASSSVARAEVPAAPKPPALPAIRNTASPVAHPVQPAPTAAAPSEPSRVLPVKAQPSAAAPEKPPVIKKMTELSPEQEERRLIEEAQDSRLSGKPGAIIGHYQQVLARHPAFSRVRLQLAELLLEIGKPEDALQVLRAGHVIRSNDDLAIASGRILAEQGRRDEALDWFARGRAGLRPADLALVGALLAQAQRFDESVKAYQRALAAEPDRGGWLLGLGVSLESLGRTEEAKAVYLKALQQGEFKPEVIEFLRKKTDPRGV